MRAMTITVLLAAFVAAPLLASGPVSRIDDLERGSMVTVAGTVQRITDEDEFRLTDGTGTVRVYVGPDWVPAAVGEAVTVDGFVDDDPGPLEIYARSLTRADGTVIVFDRRYE
ncbi:hypothetical protein [Jannaschia aquimarina]|uniref:Bacterial OB-fold domain-containing protein n=1 Tax=Jannaschia aquimarina TaxID=935700 RepID=A0A0D1EFC7_9RHOB|nr:hypothetical protein [Jannaschia aquimarina]KIT14610.1 hypothetical protein jaqu_36880 [Jannaschia aquimarina]SNS77465.1 hypothetical protein SAMN05421775_102239 [Jannaschia aquimarina]